MRFRYHEIPTLPPLAWGARLDRGGEAVWVFHGMFVETHSRGFIEGAWDDFESDLARHPPAVIVDASVGTPFSIDRFPQFAAYVSGGYTRTEQVDGVVLYVRR